MSYSSGEFVTSDWYGMTELPKWVKAFNQRALVPKYLDRKWEPMLPVERYHLALPDDNAYEGSFVANTKATFPYDLSTWKEDPKRMELIKYTPWGNTITTDMAIAALIGEEMGTDVTTDLLAISYGATDELGHYTGVRAMELEDMYIRLDQELERLLIELDQRVGADNYTLFLTADHGAVDVPQYVKDIKGSAGYVDTQSWKPKLDSLYSNELDLFPIGYEQIHRGPHHQWPHLPTR
ncbi:MAG: alkaline phosphatase family protein [Flavobacteriales bacterium]|nr:alkaline phosphatase family protein [Flavobacteriales bacterium]